MRSVKHPSLFVLGAIRDNPMNANLMNQAALVVYETQGEWARHLRRRLGSPSPEICEVRHREGCREVLIARPRSFVVYQVEPHRPERALNHLLWQRETFPQSVVACVGRRGISPWEDAFREAGAVHLIESSRRLNELITILRRHPAGSDAPDNDACDLDHWIARQLPWGTSNDPIFISESKHS